MADREDLTGPAPLTPMFAAESLAPDADPTEPRRGPPPPLPVNGGHAWVHLDRRPCPTTARSVNMVNWPLPSLTKDDEGGTALVPVSISGRMGTEGDEEATDPLWQRHLGAMVLQQGLSVCQCPGPAYHKDMEWHPDNSGPGHSLRHAAPSPNRSSRP